MGWAVNLDDLSVIRKSVLAKVSGTALVSAALKGTMPIEAYLRYLDNVSYYAQFSPQIMALAASRATSSHPELSRYLLQHAADEMGHDVWALQDIKGLAGVDRKATAPALSCRALVGFVRAAAAYENPISVFGWMYVLEAIGKDLGPAAAAALKAAVKNRDPDAVRFVEQHGEADSRHIEEIEEQLQRWVRSPHDTEAVLTSARTVAQLYVQMFVEIGSSLSLE